MNYYIHLRLDELDIASPEEAEELEFELELRFEEFTPTDRETWLKQNAYLDQFSQMGTVTSAASRAGVTVFTAMRWNYDDVLGFSRRLEVAILVFKDRLQHKALLRASDPKAPATLLIELLRSNIPENSTTSATIPVHFGSSIATAKLHIAKRRQAIPPSVASCRAIPTPSARATSTHRLPIPPPPSETRPPTLPSPLLLFGSSTRKMPIQARLRRTKP